MFGRKEEDRRHGRAQRIMMTNRRRNDNEEDYFSDPVKLVHTAEDRTFITDVQFIDAEIIDLGDILSSDEDADYDPPQMDQALIPTQVTTPACGENSFFNPSVDLVDCCKRALKNKSPTRITDTKKLENKPIKVKHQVQKSDDTQSDSDIEIIEEIDSNKSKLKKPKGFKNDSRCLNYNEKEIQKAIAERNMVSIVDIKKNTGLIGMKIKRSNVDLKTSSGKENTSNEKETNNTRDVEKASIDSNNIHKVKTKNKSIKKDKKLTFKDKQKKYVTERRKTRKHVKKDSPKILDIAKQIVNDVNKPVKDVNKPANDVNKPVNDVNKPVNDVNKPVNDVNKPVNDVNKSPISKFSLSPEKFCTDFEKSSLKNGMITKEKVEKVKYNANCSDKEITQNSPKVNDIDYDIKRSNGMKIIVGRSNPNMNNVVENRSFPKLNKFTKNVLAKIQKIKKYKTSPTNPVKINQEEKLIKTNMNLESMAENNKKNKDIQKYKDLQSDNIKTSDTNLKDNDNRKNMKIHLVPKLPHSPKHNKKLILESSLRVKQHSLVNNKKIQPADYSASPVVQKIEMNTKEVSVVKLPYQMPSISSNMLLIAPKTNAQSQYNISNINNTKETQHVKNSIQSLDRIEETNNQKQFTPLTLHSLPFHSAKPPSCGTNETGKNVNCLSQSFSDAIMKKIPRQPHNMNMYQPPPPNALPTYQCFYPMTMPSIPDNYQGYRVGSYVLPYGTEIFSYPPPQLPPPPPPLPPPTPIPPAAQQHFQQAFPNTNQLSTQNSIIGRNSNSHHHAAQQNPQQTLPNTNQLSIQNSIIGRNSNSHYHAAQQQLQQTLPNTNQLFTENSIIGRNSNRDHHAAQQHPQQTSPNTNHLSTQNSIIGRNSNSHYHAAQQHPQQILPNTNQLFTENSIIGRNSNRDYHAAQQQLQQTLPNTNQLFTKSSIIDRNSNGIISGPPPTRPDVCNTEVNSKEVSVKTNNTLEYCKQDPKKPENVVGITSTVINSGKCKELVTVIQPNVTVFTHSPKNNSKRPLTSQSPIRDKFKTNKPCPLSKKVKISDPRKLPNNEQIHKEPVKKGYSPPILPIPTFETMLSQCYDKGTIPDTMVEKPVNKNKVFPQQRHGHFAEVRKISLDEYKKKKSVPSDKTKEIRYRRLDKLVKNLYQK